MSAGSSANAHTHAHVQQQQHQQQEEDQEDLYPPDNFSMVDAGIYRSELYLVEIDPRTDLQNNGHASERLSVFMFTVAPGLSR